MNATADVARIFRHAGLMDLKGGNSGDTTLATASASGNYIATSALVAAGTSVSLSVI